MPHYSSSSSLRRVFVLLSIIALVATAAACGDGSSSDPDSVIEDVTPDQSAEAPGFFTSCAQDDIGCVCAGAWAAFESTCGAQDPQVPLACDRADLPSEYASECQKAGLGADGCWHAVGDWSSRCLSAIDSGCSDFGRCMLYDLDQVF